MQACQRCHAPLAAPQPGSRRAPHRHGRTLLAVAAGVIGLSAWRQFRLLLSQIPDSNDDFTYH